MNLRRWDNKIAFGLVVIFFATVVCVPVFIWARGFVLKNKEKTEDVTEISTIVEDFPELVPIEDSVQSVVKPTKEEIAKNPPKRVPPSGKSASSTVKNSDGTSTTSYAESDTSLPNSCKTTKTNSGGASPSAIYYTDSTEQNAALENILKNYLDSHLKWGGEISSLYEIVVCNAGDVGWEGQYLGSYMQDNNGKIVSARGYIILNTHYHQNSPQFNDYMKLVLSHEYGHHYSLYHKWIDLQLPIGVRFPDAYYSARPLSKTATAVDYSLGWQNCEAEIVAEDYSYLYSGYGYHAMAGSYGYPSLETKTWFNSLLTEYLTPTNKEAILDESPIEKAPIPDIENPTVSITLPSSNPYLWNDDKNLTINILAQDNVGVVKVKIFINDIFSGEIADSNLSAIWKNSNVAQGTYIVMVEAYDEAGNIGETTLTVIKK